MLYRASKASNIFSLDRIAIAKSFQEVLDRIVIFDIGSAPTAKRIAAITWFVTHFLRPLRSVMINADPATIVPTPINRKKTAASKLI